MVMATTELPSQEIRSAFVESIPLLVEEQLVGDGMIVQIKALEFGLVKISPDLATLTEATFSHGKEGFELTGLNHFTNPHADKLFWEPVLMTDEYRIK